MSNLLDSDQVATVLDLHQAREDGLCSQCRGATWPCKTFVTLTGRPHQTVEVARALTGLLPMTTTLLTQVDKIATDRIDPTAFTAAADLLTGRHPDSAALGLLLDLVRTRSNTPTDGKPQWTPSP